MKARKKLIALLLLPVLVISACSIPSITIRLPEVTLPGLQSPEAVEARPATAVPTQPRTEGEQRTSATAEPQAVQTDAPAAAGKLSYEAIYEKVNPSVVSIQVSGSRSVVDSSGVGSGFVWDKEGNIVTNAHVVSSASQIWVTFADGSMVEADLVGTDRYSDLAVIRVDLDPDRLSPVEMGDSRQVKVGQTAIAIGNPFGLANTMTQGIISGLSRSLPVELNNSLSMLGGRYSIPDIIQTDASINPGNSGGVLVDEQGRVIGVTFAIVSTTQTNAGVGFVIPAAIVQRFVPALIEDGAVDHSWIGISGNTLTPSLARQVGLPENLQGALVLTITANSPAMAAGLQGGSQQTNSDGQTIVSGGDVIIAIDGQKVRRFDDLVSHLYNYTDPGQVVTLTVLRDGNEIEIQLTLGVLPE